MRRRGSASRGSSCRRCENNRREWNPVQLTRGTFGANNNPVVEDGGAALGESCYSSKISEQKVGLPVKGTNLHRPLLGTAAKFFEGDDICVRCNTRGPKNCVLCWAPVSRCVTKSGIVGRVRGQAQEKVVGIQFSHAGRVDESAAKWPLCLKGSQQLGEISTTYGILVWAAFKEIIASLKLPRMIPKV